MKPIIDISFYQAPSAIDYDLLAENVSGVILRACYGIWKDTAFDRHYAEFTARGVPVGAYHYIIGSAPMNFQATAFNNAIDGKVLKLGCWIDVEDTREGTRLYRDQVLIYAEEQPDMGIYTSKGAWNAIMGGAYLTDRKLWVAHYTSNPYPLLPTGWDSWWLWQFTSSGRLAGYAGNLDCNRFNGDDADFAAWVGIEQPAPIEKLFDARVYSWATPYVNIRALPDITSKDLGNVYPNEVVAVTSVTGDWYRTSYMGTNGFVMSRFLQRVDDLPLPPPMSGDYAYYGAVYSQRDIRWAAHPLGTKSTIGAHGCLMTAVSMVCNKFGHASNPLQLNNWLTDNDGYMDCKLYIL